MKKLTATLMVVLAALAMAATAGCGSDMNAEVVLSTTTSTQDSGLLDYLLPVFESRYNRRVKTIAVGSGEAVKMGERGDADVVLAHSEALEREFVDEGFGLERVEVMYNDFVIAGPASDPAGIRSGNSAGEAFGKIAAAAEQGKATFASRADGSGTNTAELGLWKESGVEPAGRSWYIATGQGMGETLAIADEKQSYTLADRATYVTRQGEGLEVLFESDPALYNQYSVIVVNPGKHPGLKLNTEGAGDFVWFLTGEEGQDLIGEYRLKGVELFIPNAVGETRGMGGGR